MTILVDARPMVDGIAGGVPRVARGLIPALIDACPEHRFVLGTTGMRRQSAPFTHIRIPNKLWSSLCVARLTSFDRVFAKEKPDHLFLPNIGFIGEPRVPYTLVVHDLSFLIEPRWFSFKAQWWHRAVQAKKLIKNATHLFAVSERTRNDLIRLLDISTDKITVIPMGISSIPIIAEADAVPSLKGRRFVLSLGFGDARKNSACALAAFHAIKNDVRYADVQFVAVGRKVRPEKDVLAIERPTDKTLAWLMQNTCALLYPSWYEGFGLPLHEAAQFHTPCIASTAGALPETAPQGTLFAPPAKPHLWAVALADVLEHPEHHQTTTTLGSWSAAAAIIKNILSRRT
ncbi:MAG: glycosyltransferase family 1 protein [Patescibacteria group bacterium]